MTYNVHSCRGTDGRLDAERVARVIEACRPDIVALQEVDVGQTRSERLHQAAFLAERLGFGAYFTAARACDGGHYGNAVLSRFEFQLLSEACLPRRKGEIRAVQWLKIRIGQRPLHLMNTHLSIHFRERNLQIRALFSAEWLAQSEAHSALLVCGDLNASPYSPVYRQLARALGDVQLAGPGRAKATWPSRFPFWRIDHLFTSRALQVLDCTVPRSPLVRLASDHLPIVAELAWSDLEPQHETRIRARA